MQPAHAQTGTVPDEGIRSQPPQAVLLQGAHVVCSTRQEFEQADLLIRDGKIVAVATELAAPPGAKVIDCSERFLYPALVDALVEVESDRSQLLAGYWNDQVTPQHRVAQTIEIDSAQVASLRKAGIGAFLAAPKGGLIKGQSCVLSTADASLAQCVLRPVAFQHFQLYPSERSRDRYPNSPMGAVALVRQALYDTDWYAKAQRAVAADRSLPTPEHNVALESLGPALIGTQSVVVDGNNELYALRADRLAREFALRLVIRGSGREYRQMDAVAASHRTIIVPVDFPAPPDVGTQDELASATLQSLMHWRLAPENPGRLEKSGVSFVITSDGLSKATDLIPNVRKAIEYGLTPETALYALTEGPAKLLQIDQLTGTLEAGMLANLLLCDGPLFDEETEIIETWVQGKPFRAEPEAGFDLSGKWGLELRGTTPTQLVLSISGDGAKRKGKIGLPKSESNAEDDSSQDAASPDDDSGPADSQDDAKKNEKEDDSGDVKDFKFEGYVLSGTFDSESTLGIPGRAILGASVLVEEDAAKRLEGALQLPDGRRIAFTANRLEDETESAEAVEGERPDATEDREPSDTREDENEDGAKSKATDGERVACEVNYPLGAYGVVEPPPQQAWVLIKNATIWTCGEAGTLSGADMLIQRGVIHSVGHGLTPPEGAKIIDATGMHVTPGIIDCHSHMATDGGVNESAQAVTAEVRIGDFIDPNDITIYRQLAGGVTTSNILHGSANPIGGQNQVIKLRWGSLGEAMKMSEAPAGIKFALGENVKQSNRGEEYTTRYPQTRMGVEQIIRDRFEAAKLYRRTHDAWSANPRGLPPRRDLELDALSEILSRERWVHCHSYRQDEILALIRIFDDYEITIGSLQHILEGYKVADAIARHGAMASAFSDWWAYKFEVLDAIPYNGAIMHRAGIIVSFNSDDAELARHLNHEAAKAVKYGGVAPEEALKFVTLNPAKQLRIEQYVGSLEAGKHADFVLWNRPPLSTLSMCLQTWIDGRKYFDRDEDLVRRNQDAELHRALVQSVLTAGESHKGGSQREDPSTWWVRYDEFCNHGHDEHQHEH